MDKGEFAHSVKRSPKVEENSKKITFLCVFRNAQDVEVWSAVVLRVWRQTAEF